jgi:hypothetical protein
LEGKLVTLKNPLVVMQKETESPESPAAPGLQTSWKVRGVIRKKYLFKNRPKPLTKTQEPLAKSEKLITK